MRVFNFITVVLIGLTTSLSVSAIQKPSAIQKAIASVDEMTAAEIKQGKIVGASLAVVNSKNVAFIKAYGLRKLGEKTPVDLDTAFQLGSVSKPVTVSLVSIAQKKNLISLDELVTHPVVKLKPGTKVRHLLSHTSGHPRAGWNWKIEHGQPRAKLLEKLSASKQGEPGEIYDYNNLTFSLIEEVLASAFKKPFGHALQKEIFEPFGMVGATAGFTDFKNQKNRAWPHEKAKGDKMRASDKYSHLYHSSVVSAAGMNANIKAMAAYLRETVNDKNLAPFYEPIVAAPDAKRWYKKLIQGEFDSHYGYGWRILDIKGERIVFHGGWVKGFMNFLAFSPKHQVGIVILSNSECNFSLRATLRFFESLEA